MNVFVPGQKQLPANHCIASSLASYVCAHRQQQSHGNPQQKRDLDTPPQTELSTGHSSHHPPCGLGPLPLLSRLVPIAFLPRTLLPLGSGILRPDVNINYKLLGFM